MPRAAYPLIILCFGLALLEATSRADTPLPGPTRTETFSPDGKIIAVSDPESNSTTLFRVSPDGDRTKLWAMHGWHRSLHVHNDGEHVVIGYPGLNLLPLNHRRSEPMLHFLRKGELLRVVPLDELITDRRNLHRTVSHYAWGSVRGFDKAGRLMVATNEGLCAYRAEDGKLMERK